MKAVYYITSLSTGRVYVGSTTRTTKQRFAEHLHYLRKNTHHSKHLQRIFNKYGEADLAFSVAQVCDECEDLLAAEQAHIDKNITIALNTAPVSDSIYAAHHANRGRKMTDEEKERRRAAALLAIEEGRQKHTPWSDERKAAHAIRLKGRKMPPVKQSTMDNISEALRARHALLGTSAKKKLTDERTAFIGREIQCWLDMRAKGMSYREMERVTGRCRKVLSRECGKALA